MSPDKIRFHFDPRCPWCYMTSRWAVQLERLGVIEIEWAVFSLVTVNNDADRKETSEESLRTVIAIRREGRGDLVGAFYSAFGKRVWEQAPQPQDLAAVARESLVEIGLDPSLCDKALADPTTWDEVLEEHHALINRTRSFGVPTIVLDGGEGPAIFGPVISTLPSDEDAVELWKHVSWLARYENFSELKRNRVQNPTLVGLDWKKEQEDLAAAKK